MILFDANTLATYRTFFGSDHEVEYGGRRFLWSGQAEPAGVLAGGVYEAASTEKVWGSNLTYIGSIISAKPKFCGPSIPQV